MKKWRNKILSAVLVLSLLLTSSSFAFAVDGEGTTEEPVQEVKITRDEIASLTPSSEHDPDEIGRAFDGNKDTFWHTKWNTTGDGYDSFIEGTNKKRAVVVKFKDFQWISKLSYLPKSGTSGGEQNGKFKICEIYIKDSDGNWSNTPYAKSETWANDANWKTLSFEPVFVDSILIYASETYGEGDNNTNAYACAKEIELYKDMSKYPTITEQPKSAVYAPDTSINELTVSAKAADESDNVSYQWYESNTDGYNGTVIGNATSYSYKPQLEPDETKYYYVKVTDSSTNASVYSDIAVVSMHNNSDNDIALVNGQYYNTLTDAISAVQAGGTVWIVGNIDLTSNITINNDVNIKSVDNLIRTTQPFTIKRTTGNNGVMFTVATNGNLTLDNIIIDGGADWGDFTPAENVTNSGKKGGSIIEVSGSGQLTVNSGAILQNNENIVSAGGAIKADSPNAKVHVYGKIWNNRTTGNTTNTWNNGGGIATNGKIYIYDGAVISGNNATVKSGAGVGGAIQVYGDGSLNIYGGTIENNKAGSGDNIGHSSSAPINLSGNFNIENINVNTISNKINIVDYVAENSSITIICNSITDGTKVAAIDEGVDTTNIVKAIKVDGKTTYRFGNDVKVGQAAAFTDGGLSETKTVMLNPNGNTSTTLTVEATGTDVTYKWYKCSTKDGEYEGIPSANKKTLNIDSLTEGSTYYYCVIDNGDESSNVPVKSNVCEVKVTDFYPCSKAIDKFKNI